MTETFRLLIRVPEERDAEVFLAIHTDPDVIRWLSGTRPKTVHDELERIARRRAMHEELGFTLWTVEEKATAEVVGLAGLFPVQGAEHEIEVAYHFRKDRWGRGYATEATRGCLRYGFDTAGLERIVGLVAPENTASARVLEKCGMGREGRARHYGTDLVKYSIDRTAASATA